MVQRVAKDVKSAKGEKVGTKCFKGCKGVQWVKGVRKLVQRVRRV